MVRPMARLVPWQRWLLRAIAMTAIFISLLGWLAMITSGALESSPTLVGIMVGIVINLPLVVVVVIDYYFWGVGEKRSSKENRRAVQWVVGVITALMLLPPIAAGGMYINNRIGYSIGRDFAFAYRDAYVNMDNNKKYFVYATDVPPNQFVSKFPNIVAEQSGSKDAITFRNPSIVTHTTQSVEYCEQSSRSCHELLISGNPINQNVHNKKYIVVINEAAYQLLSAHLQ